MEAVPRNDGWTRLRDRLSSKGRFSRGKEEREAKRRGAAKARVTRFQRWGPWGPITGATSSLAILPQIATLKRGTAPVPRLPERRESLDRLLGASPTSRNVGFTTGPRHCSSFSWFSSTSPRRDLNRRSTYTSLVPFLGVAYTHFSLSPPRIRAISRISRVRASPLSFYAPRRVIP